MLNLDPAKLLVVLVVGLVVLGPDKLPKLARQIGAAWGDLRRLRQRLEDEVRGAFPEIPSTHQVAQAVRSPISLLDRLADAHEREQAAAPGGDSVERDATAGNGATADVREGGDGHMTASAGTSSPEASLAPSSHGGVPPDALLSLPDDPSLN